MYRSEGIGKKVRKDTLSVWWYICLMVCRAFQIGTPRCCTAVYKKLRHKRSQKKRREMARLNVNIYVYLAMCLFLSHPFSSCCWCFRILEPSNSQHYIVSVFPPSYPLTVLFLFSISHLQKLARSQTYGIAQHPYPTTHFTQTRTQIHAHWMVRERHIIRVYLNITYQQYLMSLIKIHEFIMQINQRECTQDSLCLINMMLFSSQ